MLIASEKSYLAPLRFCNPEPFWNDIFGLLVYSSLKEPFLAIKTCPCRFCNCEALLKCCFGVI